MNTALARHTDPDTSHAAAARVAVRDSEKQIVRMLQIYGPMTTRELAHGMARELVTISPRMKPLEQKGLVIRIADRRDGSTVWRSVRVEECTHEHEHLSYGGEQRAFSEVMHLYNCLRCGTSMLFNERFDILGATDSESPNIPAGVIQ